MKKYLFYCRFVFLAALLLPIISLSAESSGLDSEGKKPDGHGVSIQGENLDGATSVSFNGVQASFTVVNSQLITAIPPAGLESGRVNVVVHTPLGEVRSSYVVPYKNPSSGQQIARSLAPAFGSTLGADTVTLVGEGFKKDEVYKVRFGGVDATDVSVQDGETIMLKTPAHASGEVVVEIESANFVKQELPDKYSYIMPPKIESIMPNSGRRITHSDVISIHGKGFSMLPGVQVIIGDILAESVNVKSESEIQVSMPNHAAGKVDIVVVNPDQQKAILKDGFTYLADPIIKSIKPMVSSPSLQ